MNPSPSPAPATEDLARRPEFEDALHDLVESGFGELHEEPPPPQATPAPASGMISWW